MFFFFFFNDTATTEIYTLSLHDALPISVPDEEAQVPLLVGDQVLDLSQSLARRCWLLVQKPLRGLELQGRAGERLQHAVVQVAGEAYALLGRGGLPQLAREQQVIQGLGEVASHDLA